MNEVQACPTTPMAYLSKFYAPPPTCQSAASYPGGGLVFSKFSPEFNKSSAVISLAAYSQQLACDAPESSFFQGQLNDLVNIYITKMVSAGLALACSLLQIATICSMKKWTEATKIILCLAVVQLC